MAEDVARAVTDFVAGHLPGVEVEYGQFPGRTGCMVRAAPGDPWVRRYLSGGGVRRFGYEVYLRVLPRGSEEGRVDALAALRGLQQAIDGGEAPEWPAVRTHEVTSLPSQYGAAQDGTVTYQLTAAMTYMA
uniref:hypothetical protein n=1 Tax=Parolsenella massiliensis TaxID=1871022 RepID=UPI0009349D9A|nr:hypothetical protein [Parolsenella massiliensis]